MNPRPLPPLLLLLALALLAGCVSTGGDGGPRTRITSRLVELPATIAGGLFLVEDKWDGHGPWRFLIDTGSTVTLVSPEFAKRYGNTRNAPGRPPARVYSATGESVLLASVRIDQIRLGDARFTQVPAVVRSMEDVSSHVGFKVDGILGYPLFRDVLLTLDYPRRRLFILPAGEPPLLRGDTLSTDITRRAPHATVHLAGRPLQVLIDSGSEAMIHLDPSDPIPGFAQPPRRGTSVRTVSGDRAQTVARIDGPLDIADYRIDSPVADLAPGPAALGAGVLSRFAVTFDQIRGRVTFFRPSRSPLPALPLRSPGLGFSKARPYWRVVSLVPGSPAASAGLREGDLVTRINGEPVAAWPLARWHALVQAGGEVALTLLRGAREEAVRISIFDLVP